MMAAQIPLVINLRRYIAPKKKEKEIEINFPCDDFDLRPVAASGILLDLLHRCIVASWRGAEGRGERV